MNNTELIDDYLIDRNDGMKKLITWFLNQVMQQEALNQIKARPYERTGHRIARRNGIRKRSLKTIHGEVMLDKPQFREVPFKTEVFDRYSRVEKSLRVAIAESYLQGVSTRKVQDVVSRFGLENISASEVSRIAKELDEKCKEFLERPIEDEICYLFLDASYFKVRSQGRYITKALLIATGIQKNGCREILGVKVEANEDESVWESLFEELKERGLKGVELVISDGHKGIQKAVVRTFLGASWQMCVTSTSCELYSRIFPRKTNQKWLMSCEMLLRTRTRCNYWRINLNKRDIINPRKPSSVSDLIYGITKHFLECIGEGSGQLMDWKE